MLRTCGRRPTAVLVHIIVAYFWLTDPSRRRASLTYLRNVASTPEGLAALGGTPGWRTTYRHFQAFGTSLLDRLSFLADKNRAPSPTIHGGDHLNRALGRGRGAILLGSHLGNLDVFRLIENEHGTPINAVMHTSEADRFQSVLRRIDPEIDQHVIPVAKGSVQSTFEIAAALERGEVVTILGDRVAVGQRQPTSATAFLGGAVEMPHGPLVLASLVDCPVLLAFGLRQADGSYHLHIEPFADKINMTRAARAHALPPLLQAYAQRIEAHCLRNPLQWFNFHNIWLEGDRFVN